MEIDWYDSEKLNNLANDNIRLSRMYKDARTNYGSSKAFLDMSLAKAYRNDSVEKKLSYEKALISLVIDSDDCEQAYKTMIEEEQNYKGLEKVIETQQSKVSLCQSLIKNIPK